MEEKRQIKIEEGWVVNIEREGKGYKITQILARLGYGVYLPIDTRDFTKDQWNMFHEMCAMRRINSEVKG